MHARVRMPVQNKRKDKDKVGSLFDRAREAGAQTGTSEDIEGPGGSFRGAARTLDGGVRQVRLRRALKCPWAACMHMRTHAHSQHRANRAHATQHRSTCPQDPDAPRTHVITFWRNGVFTVDDGPPRSVDDPANFSFIDSISKGECPRELDPGTSTIPINVNLLRKEEDYTEPEKPK